MPQALNSFLVSVGIIVAIALFIPCIELIVGLLRRRAPSKDANNLEESAEVYPRKAA